MLSQGVRGFGWVATLTLLIGAFCVTMGTLTADSSLKSVVTLDDRIAVARNSCEDIYYELVKQGFFDAYYNNNLIISTKIDERFTQDGEILLHLIDWLDKRNDRDSRYLLKKISKFLYLEFYRLLCQVDAQKNQNSSLLHMLKDIYKFKVVTPYGIVTPFRAALSRMIVLVFMINLKQLFYEKKREAMAYTLHKIENSFLNINASLFEKKISDESIKTFIQAMQTFITKEPLVKPSIVKSVVVTIIVLVVIVAAGIGIWQYVIPNWDSIKHKMEEVRDNIFKPIGEGMGDGLKRSLLEDPVLLEQLGRRIVHGMAISDGQPNPDLAVVSNQLGRGIVHGLARDGGGAPNPDLAVVSTQLGNGIVHGLARDGGGAPNPDLDVVSSRLGNGIIHGIARDGGGAPNPDVAVLRDQLTAGVGNRLVSDATQALQQNRDRLPWALRPPAPAPAPRPAH